MVRIFQERNLNINDGKFFLTVAVDTIHANIHIKYKTTEDTVKVNQQLPAKPFKCGQNDMTN